MQRDRENAVAILCISDAEVGATTIIDFRLFFLCVVTQSELSTYLSCFKLYPDKR